MTSLRKLVVLEPGLPIATISSSALALSDEVSESFSSLVTCDTRDTCAAESDSLELESHDLLEVCWNQNIRNWRL